MGKRFDEEELENYGIEITNVSSFIDEINSLKMNYLGVMRSYFLEDKKTILGM